MDISKIAVGKDVPNDFNVIIEIPANAAPIKYEHDKESGAVFVDRFMGTCMFYPMNYGYIPHTLAEDGDPVDALVYTPFPLIPAAVVRCRAIGMLKMEDESGIDAKLVVVPVDKLCQMTKGIQKLEDLPALLLEQVKHFFEHYKDLEPGKWVKVQGWADKEAAHAEILAGIKRAG